MPPIADPTREPTPDEVDGLRWWNGLSEAERERWARDAYSAVPADAWALFKLLGGLRLGFELDMAGLAYLVTRCTPSLRHVQLLATIRSFDSLRSARLVATTGGNGSLLSGDCKVLDAAGSVIHDDHVAWLRAEVAKDDGQASATYQRLKGAGFLLSSCELTTLTFVQDTGYAESQFLQVKVYQEDEFTDRALFSGYAWKQPANLDDLLRLDDTPLPPEARRRVRPPSYRLAQVADVERFVHGWAAHDARARGEFRKRRVTQRIAGEDDLVMNTDAAFPGWDATPTKARRLFDDWAASSAGQSGARLCDHWTLKLSDYTDPAGERHLSYIPEWTTSQKLAKVDFRKGSAQDLLARLTKLDQRVKVPFAWYFFMLHGNRVDDGAAYRLLRAVDAGEISLPERDLRVLRRWHANPYGF